MKPLITIVLIILCFSSIANATSILNNSLDDIINKVPEENKTSLFDALKGIIYGVIDFIKFSINTVLEILRAMVYALKLLALFFIIITFIMSFGLWFIFLPLIELGIIVLAFQKGHGLGKLMNVIHYNFIALSTTYTFVHMTVSIGITIIEFTWKMIKDIIRLLVPFVGWTGFLLSS